MDMMDISLGYKNNPSTFRNVKTPNRKSVVFNNARKGKSVSGRSNQSTLVLCKTAYHVVESYGAPIPVQVTEALTFSDRNTVCSGMISNDGWAWFVIGRCLLIWQVEGNKNSFGSSCREFTLPPSDLAYSANLVSVFTLHGNQNMSCVAVSPDGLVRYWPNISNEGVSIECNSNLQGQECEVIKRISPIGFIVATTTAMIMLIETSNIGGRHSITCKLLSSPSSWLGGIGRRFSSIFFGGINASQTSDSKLVRVVVSENNLSVIPSGANNYFVYVMAGYTLQKWSLCIGEPEKLLYQFSLETLIIDNFEQTIWNTTEDNEINMCVIDMQLMDSSAQSIVVLVVASNDSVPSQLHYALVVLNVDGDIAPTRIASFHLLKNIDFSVFHIDNTLKKIQLLVTGQYVYMYNHRYIVSTPVIAGCDEHDVIHLPEIHILGGSIVNRLPVFFSRLHGLISVAPSDIISPSDFVNNSTLNIDSSSISERVLDETDFDDMTMYKDSNACMKAAFLHYVSKKINQAKAIINEIFPLDDTPAQVDATLDVVAIKVSLDLIDDIPTKDPRWADAKTSEKVSLNSTLSLQIQSQLEDKQQALDWFISFLREMGLWNRLGAVTWNNVTMATTYVFAEQAEKLIAAIVLKKFQHKYPKLLESVIKNVVKNEDMVSSSGLTSFDLFYRKVSIVHKALIRMCENCEEVVCREHSIQTVVKIIADTNNILLKVLEEISLFRQEKGMVFVPNPIIIASFHTEMLSWTAALGPNGLKDSLLLQSSLTLKYGIRCVIVLSQRQELINQLISLNSIILEGWKIHVESVSDRKARHEFLLNRYENERLALIQPFMDLEEYESATTLAEKYFDFTILIQICDKTGDEEKSLFYMDKYEKMDFAQFLFSWYVREKKQDKLLTQFRSNKKHQLALSKFLVDRPTIAWIHAVFCGNYELATEVLLGLAFQEIESLKRKKYMLTIGKLALLTSECSDGNLLKKVNKEINLLSYQEDLPEAVLSAFDFDYETMKVFLPPELIRFYICEENVNANEYDFIKALDLLHFVDDELEKRELRNEIWCKSILRDIWPADDVNIEDPITFTNSFLFFKIINFALEKGLEVMSLLLPLESLLQIEDLRELTNNKTFQFLMNVAYEYYLRPSKAV